jgi:hypothetical protein
MNRRDKCLTIAFSLARCLPIVALFLLLLLIVSLPRYSTVLAQDVGSVGDAIAVDEKTDGQKKGIDFDREVLRILADRCFACHGADEATREAGLALDRFAMATATLPSGRRAIVPGMVDESELVARVVSTDADVRMPPPDAGPALTQQEVMTLRRWIDAGAEYRQHWAYQAPVATVPPDIEGAAHPIDAYVRDRLRKEGLLPSDPADRTTQLRRVTLDLIGLPPTPEETLAFLDDDRPGAYERAVDRLLGSPAFGEQWARWWLDLAHYGDSDGYLQDFLRPVAWRYRQWVVEALNDDVPFDRFTIEQVAGDLVGASEGDAIWPPRDAIRARMGTGFFRNTLSNREGGAELEEFRVKQVIDRTATFGKTWLALTVECAQCHDHKFDALSQREYYQLYAFFDAADEANFDAPLAGEAEAFAAAKGEHDRKRAELIAPLAGPLAELQADWERRILRAESHPGEDFVWDRGLELLGLQWGQNLGEGQLEGLNILKIPPDSRTAEQRERVLDYFLANPRDLHTAKFEELKLGELKRQLDELAKTLPKPTRAPGMTSAVATRETFVHVRGDFRRAGEAVDATTPKTLPPIRRSADRSGERSGKRSVGGTSGVAQADRLELARWLVAPRHPLTARVVVNRIWQELFGRGIVATSDNFGIRGDRPTHPELLDRLAIELVREGWSLKRLIRQIVTSETYRQRSVSRPELDAVDPQNRWLARQSRLRLSGEVIRDGALAASGLLDRRIGGPSVKPPQPASVSEAGYSNVWEAAIGGDRYRRGLYTFIQRTTPFGQFVTFDLPDLSRVCTRRERSNTPLQALHLLNDPNFVDAARGLAVTLVRSSVGVDDGVDGDDDVQRDAARVRLGFLRALGREPSAEERDRLVAYLAKQREIFSADPTSAEGLVGADGGVEPAWVAVASVLLNLDEFITRE